MRNRIVAVAMTFLSIFALTGCNMTSGNPENPITLKVWHYYNGTQQAIFDTLMEEFNDTVGREKGIYVEGYSHGSVSDLEKAITDSLEGKVGAYELPDIFSSYADTAYEVKKQGKLADLSQYFSESELEEYVGTYVTEGRFDGNDELYLIPVAKSTEIMMINRTDWEKFEAATGASLEELKTIEGVVSVAERYYNWTDELTPDVEGDGKAFYGRDSMSNYFIIGMKQMGAEIFESDDGELVLNTDKKLVKRLWDNYYVPYLKGYFLSCGKFRSDDVKTGDIIAYTGSTSSALYFPDYVETEGVKYNIDYIVLDAPIMENGEKYMVQQGAGMAVTCSDKDREQAACEFLKWFTKSENNLRYVCNSGYMPVLKQANNMEAVDKIIESEGINISRKTYDSIKNVLEDFSEDRFYTTKCIANGYELRMVLDYNLSDKASKDKAVAEELIKSGKNRQEVLDEFISDENFESWYSEFCQTLMQTNNK